jgi:hypothetical protein
VIHTFRFKQGACVLVVSVLGAATAHAADLNGTVVGRAGDPKGYVRVELLAPAQKSVFTDAGGKFTIRALNAGTYTVRVNERNRVTEFQINIPQGDKPVTQTLWVDW